MRSASAPSPHASTARFSIHVLQGVSWTNLSSPNYRRELILAAKTVSFTRSFSMDRYFKAPCDLPRAKCLSGILSCFAIFCRHGRGEMKTEFSERDNLMFRALLAVVMIILA